MFENLVNQDAQKYLVSDIKNNVFPRAVLFSGNDATGKLTAALEVARVLSCVNAEKKGDWNCTCSSCLRHKALTCTNMLLMGPRDCALEIAAAKETFLKAYKENAKYIVATRYLFLRSVRKLTLRFSSILWKGESSINKVGEVIEEINENLQQLDFPADLPSYEETEKLCQKINDLTLKLEGNYLYNTIPVNQIRNMEAWAYIKSQEGKKTIIIENADRMQNSVRNAILKILEEPPADCVFILLTSRKNAVLPTILSRVRNYSFNDRLPEHQLEVINRVFHNESFKDSLTEYLLNYLPVPVYKIREIALKDYYENILTGNIPVASEIVKSANNFEPKIELKLFLTAIAQNQKTLLKTPQGCEAASQLVKALQNCWDNVTTLNQSTGAALEVLTREISKINATNSRILSKSL
ncbi:MAG: DNA polymerase III [Treponema sp.]|nr:DNA polymerase III [Treponema sp.]